MADVSDVLDDVLDVGLGSEAREIRAVPAQLLHRRDYFGDGTGARRIDPEGAQHEARAVLPLVLRRAHARVEEDHAERVALAGCEARVVDQHHGRGPVPRDHVLRRGADQRGAWVECVEHAL